MIVKCIINHGKDLAPIFLRPQDGFSEESRFGITINNYYIVYGMTLFGGYVWYYISRDKSSYYPFWHPCGLFEVVNGQLSKYWVYSFVQEKTQNRLFTQTLWAYSEWINDPYYYDALSDGDEKEVNIFKKYKSLMDLEFPNPGIQDKAEAMDDNWLFCSYCIDAWQSFSTDGMVICPTCQRMMHNPSYINPLKNFKPLRTMNIKKYSSCFHDGGLINVEQKKKIILKFQWKAISFILNGTKIVFLYLIFELLKGNFI